MPVKADLARADKDPYAMALLVWEQLGLDTPFRDHYLLRHLDPASLRYRTIVTDLDRRLEHLVTTPERTKCIVDAMQKRLGMHLDLPACAVCGERSYEQTCQNAPVRGGKLRLTRLSDAQVVAYRALGPFRSLASVWIDHPDFDAWRRNPRGDRYKKVYIAATHRIRHVPTHPFPRNTDPPHQCCELIQKPNSRSIEYNAEFAALISPAPPRAQRATRVRFYF